MDFVFVLYTFLITIFNGVALSNLILAPRFKKIAVKSAGKGPFFSVIVPMRNEETNARKIIDDLLAQDYEKYEVIAVDDNSADGTWEILESYGDKIKKNRLTKHDKTWIGKSWALWNGLSRAKGDWLVFVDSDVRIKPQLLSRMTDWVLTRRVDVITCFPTQTAPTIGETLVMPLMTWSYTGNTPIALANKSISPEFAIANGQFIACSRKAYDAIGGHESIKGKVNEDISIIRRFVSKGFKVLAVLGDEIVSCRMYSSYKTARDGFSRSLTYSLGKPYILVFLLLFWMLLYLSPYVLVFFDIKFALVIAGILIHRLIVSFTVKENPFVNMLLHPIQMLILLEMSINSLRLTLSNKVVWKGRLVKNT